MLNATKNHEIKMKDRDKWRCCLNVMGVDDDITRRNWSNSSNGSINVLDNNAKFCRCWTHPRTRPVSPGLQKDVRNLL